MEDIEIARNTKLKRLTLLLENLMLKMILSNMENIKQNFLEVKKIKSKKNGKLILMTTINPTPLERERLQWL